MLKKTILLIVIVIFIFFSFEEDMLSDIIVPGYNSLEDLLVEVARVNFAEPTPTRFSSNRPLEGITELYMPLSVPQGFTLNEIIFGGHQVNAPIISKFALTEGAYDQK